MPTIPSQMWPTVERFAASLGLPAEPRADGSVAFAFEFTGTLTFATARDGDRVIMTLVRPSDLPPDAILQGGGYSVEIDALVHPGLTPAGLAALSIVYGAENFDVPTVAAHFEALARTLGAH